MENLRSQRKHCKVPFLPTLGKKSSKSEVVSAWTEVKENVLSTKYEAFEDRLKYQKSKPPLLQAESFNITQAGSAGSYIRA